MGGVGFVTAAADPDTPRWSFDDQALRGLTGLDDTIVFFNACGSNAGFSSVGAGSSVTWTSTSRVDVVVPVATRFWELMIRSPPVRSSSSTVVPRTATRRPSPRTTRRSRSDWRASPRAPRAPSPSRSAPTAICWRATSSWDVTVRPGAIQWADVSYPALEAEAPPVELEVRAHAGEQDRHTAHGGPIRPGTDLAFGGPVPIFEELASQLPPDSLTGNELRIELNSGGGPMVGEGGRSQTVRAVLVR